MRAKMSFVVVPSLLALAGCGWMNSPTKPNPSEEEGKPLLSDPSYFTIEVHRNTARPTAGLVVREVLDNKSRTAVWILDDRHVAVLRSAAEDRLFFTMDFGPDIQIAQISIEPSPSCPTGAFFIGKDELPAGSEPNECAPVAGQSLFISIPGNASDLYLTL